MFVSFENLCHSIFLALIWLHRTTNQIQKSLEPRVHTGFSKLEISEFLHFQSQRLESANMFAVLFFCQSCRGGKSFLELFCRRMYLFQNPSGPVLVLALIATSFSSAIPKPDGQDGEKHKSRVLDKVEYKFISSYKYF